MATIATQAKTDKVERSPWQGFQTGLWNSEINVRDFIQQNYEPYDGDESFLAPATKRTLKIWEKLTDLFVAVSYTHLTLPTICSV